MSHVSTGQRPAAHESPHVGVRGVPVHLAAAMSSELLQPADRGERLDCPAFQHLLSLTPVPRATLIVLILLRESVNRYAERGTPGKME